MGPEGGFSGGIVVAEGAPEVVASSVDSHTGRHLSELLSRDAKALVV